MAFVACGSDIAAATSGGSGGQEPARNPGIASPRRSAHAKFSSPLMEWRVAFVAVAGEETRGEVEREHFVDGELDLVELAAAIEDVAPAFAA